jgi:hypothetical protein
VQFEYRLIPSDSPPASDDAQLSLPDDLAAVARQLQNEARDLAACYPPPEPGPAQVSRRSRTGISARWKRWSFVSLAAVLLAMVAVSAVWLVGTRSDHLSDRQQFISERQVAPPEYHSMSNRPMWPEDVAGPSRRSQGSNFPDVPDRKSTGASSSGHNGDIVARSYRGEHERDARPPSADPVSSELLHGVSMPELEGLLDLWGSEDCELDQLSI